MRPFLLLLVFAGIAGAAGKEKERPFPFSSSTILREGKVVYVVEGTVTIPKGVEISCQKDVHIRGKGKNPTIRVVGALKIHGVSLREVILENVTVELARGFKDVHLDMAIFRSGGGVKTVKKKPVVGKLFIENVDFQTGACIDVAFENGALDLSSVNSQNETKIRAVKGDDEDANKLKVKIRASDLSGLVVEGAREVTVRLTRLAGGRCEFHDCRALTFDGNKVNAGSLEFHQSAAGWFGKTKVTKCDIYSEKVVLRCPKRGGKCHDKIVIDRCWFKGETDPKVVRKEIISDAEDDEKVGVHAKLGKLSKRPNELAGAVDR